VFAAFETSSWRRTCRTSSLSVAQRRFRRGSCFSYATMEKLRLLPAASSRGVAGYFRPAVAALLGAGVATSRVSIYILSWPP